MKNFAVAYEYEREAVFFAEEYGFMKYAKISTGQGSNI